MDMRSRLLALAVFGMFAVTLGSISFAVWSRTWQTQQELASLLPTTPPAGIDRTSLEGGISGRSSDDYNNPRVDLLRTQVERLTERVNRLSDQLDRKAQEYDALKTEHDHNVELLREMLAAEQDSIQRKTVVEAAKTEVAKAETTPDPVAELNAQLRELRSELAAMEKQAAQDELHIFDLEDRKRVLQTAASAALVRAGEAAVPALADLLTDKRSEIRRWAATVLGEIGPDAASAADVLHEALSDSDEDVQIAARKALRRIERP
jgi:chromosome segregation ATPase